MSEPPAVLADRAVLALCLEVTATPKPGNVDRHRDHEDLTLADMLSGAHGAAPGLRAAAAGEDVGTAFERAVTGMAAGAGQNTHLGALLLLVPLVRAAADELSPTSVQDVVDSTATADATAFYRAFDHVDVAVPEPPEGAVDVRRGSDAVSELEKETLQEVLARAADRDDVAREWVEGFERSFEAAERIDRADGELSDRIATAYLALLAERPDSLVRTRHGDETAEEVRSRAAALGQSGGVQDDRAAVADFADELVSRGINPGTTADLTAAGVFIALETEVISQ